MGLSSHKKIRTSTQNGSDFRPFLRHSLLRSVFDVPNVQWLEGLRAMSEDYLSLCTEVEM